MAEIVTCARDGDMCQRLWHASENSRVPENVTCARDDDMCQRL